MSQPHLVVPLQPTEAHSIGAPGYIIGLYLPERQTFKARIFDTEHSGVLDPTATESFISTSLYSQLKNNCPMLGPVNAIPILFSDMSAADPIAIFWPKDQKESDIEFQLGVSQYEFCTRVARTQISEHLSCAAEQRLSWDNLQFITSGLRNCGFACIDSTEGHAIHNLERGQKVQFTQLRSILIAAARGPTGGQLREVTVLVAPSDAERCRPSHLAAIAFREVVQHVTSGRICILVIGQSDRLGAVLAQIIHQMFPAALSITALRTSRVMADDGDYYSQAYVLWLMKQMTRPARGEIATCQEHARVASDLRVRTIEDLPAEILCLILAILPEISRVALALAGPKLYGIVRMAATTPRFRFCLPERSGSTAKYLEHVCYMEDMMAIQRNWGSLDSR